MLRLHPKADPENLPSVHHSVYSQSANTLYRVEQELPHGVSVCWCLGSRDSPYPRQLFGEDEDATGELDDAEKEGENAQEIAALRKEATAFKTVRDALRSKSSSDAAQLVFQKVAFRPPAPAAMLMRLPGLQRGHQEPSEHVRHVEIALSSNPPRFRRHYA